MISFKFSGTILSTLFPHSVIELCYHFPPGLQGLLGHMWVVAHLLCPHPLAAPSREVLSTSEMSLLMLTLSCTATLCHASAFPGPSPWMSRGVGPCCGAGDAAESLPGSAVPAHLPQGLLGGALPSFFQPS